MKKATIICTTPQERGLMFYLDVDGERYFLFNQRYRSSIENHYRKGVDLNTAISNRASGDSCIRRVSEKIPTYIKYIEKEYDIAVLNQTIKKRRSLNA